MRTLKISLPLIACSAILAACGCQQPLARIFSEPAWSQTTVFEQPQVQLIADTPSNAPAARLSADPNRKANASASDQAASSPPPATQPAAGAYTAPGSRIQQLTFLALLGATAAVPGVTGTGKEASESSLSASSSAALAGSGIAGLGAPQPRTLTAIVGQPGLQRGYAAGIGFARPSNIFTPRINRLTGPTGRCGELVGAGLFTSQSSCQAYFGK